MAVLPEHAHRRLQPRYRRPAAQELTAGSGRHPGPLQEWPGQHPRRAERPGHPRQCAGATGAGPAQLVRGAGRHGARTRRARRTQRQGATTVSAAKKKTFWIIGGVTAILVVLVALRVWI